MGNQIGVEMTQYDDLMEKITALCKGFLLIADESIEKACSFCRGILILLEQLLQVSPSSVQN